jgi:hypothetical protein
MIPYKVQNVDIKSTTVAPSKKKRAFFFAFGVHGYDYDEYYLNHSYIAIGYLYIDIKTMFTATHRQ